MSNAAEARKQVEVLLYEKIIGFYDRRKARVDTDPKWAEGNPIRFDVQKDESGKLQVLLSPIMD